MGNYFSIDFSIEELDSLLGLIEKAEDIGITLDEQSEYIVKRLKEKYNEEVIKHGSN